MSTKVQNWGNSLAVRIPDDVVEEAGYAPGKEVTVKFERNTVVIRPVAKKKPSSLQVLIEGITPQNRHDYQWKGVAAEGKELW